MQEDAAEEEAADRLNALPAKLLNNAAVLHMRAGEATAALDLMQEAIQAMAPPAHTLPQCFLCIPLQASGNQLRQMARTRDYGGVVYR